ncbi:lytic transglycosylase [Amycolatopsis antarctica]|uniref:Lytic transglycosylase n=1 Tax=Amycolatopsis antarctica TaxID=1854586 RepID=A0A263D216_9PSEU|nr:lytic transglycosylase [Amycolatopsis antarctica]
MLGAMGPERRTQFGLDSNKDLFDAGTNAEVANALSGDGSNWRPWSTYTNGAYRRHLDAARRAAKELTARKGKGGTRKDGARPGKGGGGAGAGGFDVDPEALGGYVRNTRRAADEIGEAARQSRAIREIAEDSFGKIGKESGFAAAPNGFGSALGRQVRTVGSNADALASSTAKGAKAYREKDDDIAGELMRIIERRR